MRFLSTGEKANLLGVAVGIVVGMDVNVGVVVGVNVGVAVEVNVGVGEKVAVGVGVHVDVSVAVGEGVSVAVEDGVAIKVNIPADPGMFDSEGVNVEPYVWVAVVHPLNIIESIKTPKVRNLGFIVHSSSTYVNQWKFPRYNLNSLVSTSLLKGLSSK